MDPPQLRPIIQRRSFLRKAITILFTRWLRTLARKFTFGRVRDTIQSTRTKYQRIGIFRRLNLFATTFDHVQKAWTCQCPEEFSMIASRLTRFITRFWKKVKIVWTKRRLISGRLNYFHCATNEKLLANNFCVVFVMSDEWNGKFKWKWIGRAPSFVRKSWQSEEVLSWKDSELLLLSCWLSATSQRGFIYGILWIATWWGLLKNHVCSS